MPSAARQNFENNLLSEVRLLIEVHKETYKGPGRPPSVLTRSAVFLLCAAWELYAEEVTLESAHYIVDHCSDPMNLPDSVRATLARSVKAEQNELAVLSFAGDGWKAYLRSKASERVAALHTPRAERIADLFSSFVGVDLRPFFQSRSQRISDFVSKRGDIAHKGANAGHVGIKDTDADFDFICKLVAELDNHLVSLLQPLGGHRPWNRRG